VGYFAKLIEGIKGDLAKAKDDKASAELKWRLLCAEANLQTEKDFLASLDTGRLVRTRTAWDVYNAAIMAQQGRETAAFWHGVNRKLSRMDKVIALADPADRDRLREFWNRSVKPEDIARGDYSRLNDAYASIAKTVSGQAEAEAASREEKLIDAEYRIQYAQNVKTISDYSLAAISMYASAPVSGVTTVSTAMSTEAVISLFYSVTTGTIEGGLVEGFKQLACGYSNAAALFSVSMQAYHQGVLDHLEEHAQNPGKVKMDESSAGLRALSWTLFQQGGEAVFMNYVMTPALSGLKSALNPPKPPGPSIQGVNWHELPDWATKPLPGKGPAASIPRPKLIADPVTGKPGLALEDALNMPSYDVMRLRKSDPVFRAAYDNTMKSRLDTTTPPNGAVFWSGDAGRMAAEASGKVTLNVTQGGKFAIANAGKKAFWHDQKTYYVALSEGMARNASGEVHAYLTNGIKPGTIFNDFELPLLKANPKVTRIVIHVPDGRGGWTARTLPPEPKNPGLSRLAIGAVNWNDGTFVPGHKWPTVAEILAQDEFKSRKANARAMVNLFKKQGEEYRAAVSSKASPARVADLRAKAEATYKLLKNDAHAKTILKNSAGSSPDLNDLYCGFDKANMAKLRGRVNEILQNQGVPAQNLEFVSNSANRGSVGMDIDLCSAEPPRWIQQGGKKLVNPQYRVWRENLKALPKGGGPARPLSPAEFQSVAQKAMRDAYRDVYGQEPRDDFLTFTYGEHAEAYKDRYAWTGEKTDKPHADFPNVDPDWVSQAGDVTLFKVSHLKDSAPGKRNYSDFQEQCRGMVKDMNTKLFGAKPDTDAFGAEGGKMKVNPDSPLGKAPATVQKHFADLREVMDDFARDRIGPIEADRRIRTLTGGRGVAEVAQQMSVVLQGSLGRAAK